MRDKLQRGQALILIALAFVGLAGFLGLAVDGGILYSNIGHLRKAVDAAALAAANQFREGLTVNQLESSAKEFLDLNNLSSATAQILVCQESIDQDTVPPYGPNNDSSLCLCEDPSLTFGDPGCTSYEQLDNRKLVKVVASLPVEFAFLPIIGFDSVDIHAEAVSETAALDLILVLDTSPSMAYDLCSNSVDDDGDGVVDDCKINKPPDPPQNDPISDSDVPTCVSAGNCQPYEDVRSAAQFLIDRMYFPFDRMGIITFSRYGVPEINLTDGDNWTDVTAALNATDVSPEPDPSTYCPDIFSTGDPTGCLPTNIASGIRAANQELVANGREEAVWIIILLSDGAANAALDDSSPQQWICPGSTGNPNWVLPFCVDTDPASRHTSASPNYDPDDRARDMADLAGCLPAPNQAASCPGGGGNGVVMFSVGLGDYVTDNKDCDTSVYSAAECTDAEDLGEQLLRYVAAVGDDGDPATDPCSSIGIGTDCGNYYYSPTGSGVLRVFEAIAGRIFTRITH
jgi:hypothetical protein